MKKLINQKNNLINKKKYMPNKLRYKNNAMKIILTNLNNKKNSKIIDCKV